MASDDLLVPVIFDVGNGIPITFSDVTLNHLKFKTSQICRCGLLVNELDTSLRSNRSKDNKTLKAISFHL